MCAYKVTVLWLVLVFTPAIKVCDAQGNASGFAFEILLAKLEYLQYKLIELESTMSSVISQQKKDRESLEEKLYNLSASIQAQSKMMEQTVDTKQEKLHKAMQQLASKQDIARCDPVMYYRNISFSSCNQVPLLRSGAYSIEPFGYDRSFVGYCEQTRFGGGWLVIQFRYDGSVNFDRDWEDYLYGFGSLNREFWLGLKLLHLLTLARPHELLVELKDFDDNYVYARYSEFEIGSEKEGYTLKKLGSYTGTAGDSFTGMGQKFTTKDRDNDDHADNCAKLLHGGWWYSNCTGANLNGNYQDTGTSDSLFWYSYKYKIESLAYTRMMIRENEHHVIIEDVLHS